MTANVRTRTRSQENDMREAEQRDKAHVPGTANRFTPSSPENVAERIEGTTQQGLQFYYYRGADHRLVQEAESRGWPDKDKQVFIDGWIPCPDTGGLALIWEYQQRGWIFDRHRPPGTTWDCIAAWPRPEEEEGKKGALCILNKRTGRDPVTGYSGSLFFRPSDKSAKPCMQHAIHGKVSLERYWEELQKFMQRRVEKGLGLEPKGREE